MNLNFLFRMSKAKIWISIITMGFLTMLFLRTCTEDNIITTRYSSDEQYSIYCKEYKYYLTFPGKHGVTPVKMFLYDRIEKEVIFKKRLDDYGDFLSISFDQSKLHSKNSRLSNLQFTLPRPIKYKQKDMYIKDRKD